MQLTHTTMFHAVTPLGSFHVVTSARTSCFLSLICMHLALDRYVVTRHWFKMGKANRKVVGLPLISLSEVRNSHVKKAPRSDPFSEGITIRVPEAPNFRSNDLGAARDNRPWPAPRNDAAACNYTRKARRPQAAVWNSEQCQQALNDLKRDYTASSSKGPNASLLRTWESIHRRMNQGKNDYYPLTRLVRRSPK